MRLSITLPVMNVGDVIEQYAFSYVVVAEKKLDESGKPQVTVIDRQGNSSVWQEGPNLRTQIGMIWLVTGVNPTPIL